MAGTFFGIRTKSPKSQYNPESMKRQIRSELNRIAAQAKRDLQKTVATWDNKPIFTVQTSTKGGDLVVSVETQDRVYGFITLGTAPHAIQAKNAPALRFRTGYRAKTRPNSLDSSDGGSFGGFIRKVRVMHPGTQARNFHKLIGQRLQKNLQQSLNAVIRSSFSRSE